MTLRLAPWLILALAAPAMAQSPQTGGVDIAPLAPQPGPALAGFPQNIAQCWNHGALPAEAQGIRLLLSVALADTGLPEAESIRLVEASPGSADAVEQAYQAARRAILRCGRAAVARPAPAELHGRTLEITFDPSGVSSR